jgi:hypothetical protein
MLNNIITSRAFQLFIPIIVALFTTGFLRLQLFSGLPEADGGAYTFASQYIYYAISNFEDLKGMPLYLYSIMTSWVYGLEVNQFILLRLIDGLVAIAASIVLFKVILKESGSTLFTVILATGLFIIMNNIEIVMYGFRNAIWAAFLPLFSALLIWQNSTQEDKYSFYLIGALVSFGVLLREPFLVFFILAGIAILIGYGWRILLKYLIGSAVLGFTVLGLMLMLRDWDLFDLVNAYFFGGTFYQPLKSLNAEFFTTGTLYLLQSNWFIFITATISIVYLVKSYSTNKKLVNIKRFYFWLAVVLVTFLEPYFKTGFPYHFVNCLPGLAGLSAIGWHYISNQESKKTTLIAMVGIGLMSLMIILPTVDRKMVKSFHVFTPLDAMRWAKSDLFQIPEMIERSQYLIAADKISRHSRKDSTLTTNGLMQVLFPLTDLLPPDYVFNDLNLLFKKLNRDEGKLIKMLEQYRPTLIIALGVDVPSEKYLFKAIEKSNLYNKVETIIGNQNIDYGWKFKNSGIIYRLKDFK